MVEMTPFLTCERMKSLHVFAARHVILCSCVLRWFQLQTSCINLIPEPQRLIVCLHYCIFPQHADSLLLEQQRTLSLMILCRYDGYYLMYAIDARHTLCPSARASLLVLVCSCNLSNQRFGEKGLTLSVGLPCLRLIPFHC